MSKINDPQYLRNEQYRTAQNLNARIRLHLQFSANPYGWFRWVFDHYHFPAEARLLELGCGPGDLWRENRDRLPPGWQITLSDFSPGMLAQARQNLAGLPVPVRFANLDAQALPFASHSFDAVIANHCLYHFPDRPQALAEIRRVLAPGGRFFATTIGETHMQPLPALLARFDPAIEDALAATPHGFTLENGAAQLQACFPQLRLSRYPDALLVSDPAALVDYMFSSVHLGADDHRRAELDQFITRQMAESGGAIRIHKDSGLFEAW